MANSFDQRLAEIQALQNATGQSSDWSLHDLRQAFYGGGVKMLSQNDAIRSYLQSQLGITSPQSLTDLWRLFFQSKGITNQVSLGDMANYFFTNVGFTKRYSLHFDGSTSEVTVNNNATLNFTTQAFTIECWVNADALQTNNVQEYMKKDSQWILRMDLGIPKFIIWTANNAGLNVSGGTLSLHTWTHIAGTYDGTNASLFVNGSRVAQSAATGNISTATNNLTIGWASSEGFPGYIKEARISNSVRYSGTTYTVPTSEFAKDANTIALYHFDDGGGTILSDSSGNGLNGTLGGTTLPTWSTNVPF